MSRGRLAIPGLVLFVVLGGLLAFRDLDDAPLPSPPDEETESFSVPVLPSLSSDAGEETPPPLPPDRMETVRGLVLSRADRSPVAGARIKYAMDGRTYRARADSEGVYSLDLPPGRDWRNFGRAEAEGYLPGYLQLAGVSAAGWVDPTHLEPVERMVYGRVSDIEGEPIRGAFVLIPLLGPLHRTGSDGRFGPVSLGEGGASWAAWTPSHAREEGKYESGPLEIVLSPAVWAHGVIVDEAGRALAGVDVFERGEGNAYHVQSGADGSFRWPMAAGDLVALEVRKSGYLATSYAIEVYAGGACRIEMRQSVRVEGRVVLADGTPPPPGLLLSAPGDYALLSATGEFDLGPVQAGEFELTVSRAFDPDRTWPHLTLGRFPMAIRPGETRRGLTLMLPALGTLKAVVRDEITGKPLAGASLLGGVSGADGVLSALMPLADAWPKNHVRPIVRRDGFAPKRLDLDPSSESLEIDLLPLAEVRVVAVDGERRPLAGTRLRATIENKVWEEWTGPDGVLELALPGGQKARLDLFCGGVGTARRLVDPVSGKVLELGEVVLSSYRAPPPEGREHRILVTDEAGAPIPGAWFAFSLDGPSLQGMDDTGAILVKGRNKEGFVGAPGMETRRVTLPGTVALRHSAPVTGRLLDAEGRPVRDQGVMTSKTHTEALTDARGRFRIDSVAAGERILLSFDLYGHPSVETIATAGGPEVEVRLPPRGRIRIRPRGKPATPEPTFRIREPGEFEDWFLSQQAIAFWRRDGADVVIDCPAGVWPVSLRWEPGAWAFWPAVEVKGGRETILDYDFPRLGTVRVRVSRPDGSPAEDAKVSVAATGGEFGRTDEEGLATLDFVQEEGVPAGTFRLRVDHWDCAPGITEPVDLTGDREVAVRLSPGGRLIGEVRDLDGRPLSGTVTVLSDLGPSRLETWADEEGSFEFESALAPGLARLRATVRGCEPAEGTAVINAGRTTEVVIVVP